MAALVNLANFLSIYLFAGLAGWFVSRKQWGYATYSVLVCLTAIALTVAARFS